MCDLRIACVGDSLTRGDGLHELPPKFRAPYSPSASWAGLRQRGNYPAFLQRLLNPPSAQSWRGVQVRNFGHGGSTACNASGGRGPPYASVREYPAALAFSPHVVVLMLGTNDAKRHLWGGRCGAKGLRQGLHDIISSFRHATHPPALLLLLEPPPMQRRRVFGIERDLLVKARRTVVRFGHRSQQHASADRGSMQVALVPPPPITSDQAFFTADGLHLNANGSALLACHIVAAFHQTVRQSERLSRLLACDASLAPFDGVAPSACWEPFCSHGRDALDDASARRCDDESGIGSPYLFTGWPCTDTKFATAGAGATRAPAGAATAQRGRDLLTSGAMMPTSIKKICDDVRHRVSLVTRMGK